MNGADSRRIGWAPGGAEGDDGRARRRGASGSATREGEGYPTACASTIRTSATSGVLGGAELNAAPPTLE